VLFVFYRRSIPARFDNQALPSPADTIKERRLFHAGWAILGVLLAGYLLSEALNSPVAIPASIAAVVFLVLASRSPALSSAAVLREVPWRIVAFSVGMYLVVYGLSNAGLTAYLSDLMRTAAHGGVLPATLVGGFATAVLSAVMNNTPTTLIAALSVHGAHASAATHQALIYANVVGADLSPKSTPIG
jgi:arsenical pump membrane protein